MLFLSKLLLSFCCPLMDILLVQCFMYCVLYINRDISQFQRCL